MSIYDFEMQTITGDTKSLGDYKGKVLLFMNVASECGFTRQYKELQNLWEEYQDQGLVILGFPVNNFGAQEPGSDAEIKVFVDEKFGITFPMFSKISVKGKDQHPLYAHLTKEAGEEIQWNFNKILVDPDGQVVAYFPSPVEPYSNELLTEIANHL